MESTFFYDLFIKHWLISGSMVISRICDSCTFKFEDLTETFFEWQVPVIDEEGIEAKSVVRKKFFWYT